MQQYRVYRLDPTGHVFEAARLIAAETDAEAIAQAEHFAVDHHVEIWDGARLVGKVERRS